MTRLLLTGASGFVGTHVVRQAVQRGWTVYALIRPESNAEAHRALGASVVPVRADLGDRASVRTAITQAAPDVCIHLAWYAEPGKYLTAPNNVASLANSLQLAEELIAAGCGAIVGAGTCFEYAPAAGPLREDMATRPATLYAAAKLSMGEVAARLADGSATAFSWARFFYLYGPGEDPRRLVPAAIRALTDGQRFSAVPGDLVRDYLHVEDVAAALITIAQARARGVYNVASGEALTIRALLERIATTLGRQESVDFGVWKPRDWEPQSIYGDNARLRALGWNPAYPLAHGIDMTIDWWRQREP